MSIKVGRLVCNKYTYSKYIVYEDLNYEEIKNN